MPITNGYTTLDEFKEYALPDGATDAGDDAVIEEIIEAVSRYIDGQTGRKFWATGADEVRYYTAECAGYLYVGDFVSVTSIEIDEDNSRTYPTTLDTSDYDLLPYNASLETQPYRYIEIAPNSSFVFPTYRKAIKITGKFGWNAPPRDIVEACNDIARSVYRRRFGENVNAATNVTAAGITVTPRDLSDFSRRTLLSYQRKF